MSVILLIGLILSVMVLIFAGKIIYKSIKSANEKHKAYMDDYRKWASLKCKNIIGQDNNSLF